MALGARRLAFIDVAGDRQPISSENGTVWVAQEGELYKYPEIRRDLLARGHVLKTRCDMTTLTGAGADEALHGYVWFKVDSIGVHPNRPICRGLAIAGLGIFLSRPFPAAILAGSPVAIFGFVAAFWRGQELACFLYLVVPAIAFVTRRPPAGMLLYVYALFVVVLFLHSIRIMVGHRCETEKYPQGRIGQILDSYNFTRNPLVTKLMAPLTFSLPDLPGGIREGASKPTRLELREVER